MESTAGVNITNHTTGEAVGVEKHNKRELENDSNENINEENSDLNRSLAIDSMKNLHDRVKDEIDLKNANTIKQYTDKKYSRKQFESNYIVDDLDYMSRGTGKSKDGKKAVASLVIQVGGTKEYREFLDNENIPYDFDERKGFTYPDKDKIERVADLYNDTYLSLHKELVASGAFIENSYDLHMDEGYPHVHDQLLNNGETANGNRSFSTNQSISKFLEYEGLPVEVGSTASKKNMRTFREFTDNYLIDEFNKNLESGKFKTRDVKFVRTGDDTKGVTPKRRKTAMQKSDAELKKANEKVAEAKAEGERIEADNLAKEVLLKTKHDKKRDEYFANLKKLKDAQDKTTLEYVEQSKKLSKLTEAVIDAGAVKAQAEAFKGILEDTGIPPKIAETLSKGGKVKSRAGTMVDGASVLRNQVLNMSKDSRDKFDKRQISKQLESKSRSKQKSSDELER